MGAPKDLTKQTHTLYETIKTIPDSGAILLHTFTVDNVSYNVRCLSDSSGEAYIVLATGDVDDETQGFLKRTCVSHVKKWTLKETKEMILEAHRIVPIVLMRHIHEV